MSDLLKQAIADAKTVRATALANAKAALEEAFAPKLQSMLGEKLRQEIDAGEEEASVADFAPAGAEGGEAVGLDQEVPAPAAEVPGVSPVAAPVDAPAVDLAPAVDAPVDAAPVDAAPVPTDGLGLDDDVPVDEVLGQGHVDPVDQTNVFTEGEKASSDYKKTTSGHKTEDPGKKMVVDANKLSTKGSLPSGKKDAKASTDYKKTATGNQVKNIKASGTEDPQGASNERDCGPKKGDTSTAAPLSENDEELDDSSLEEILKELESSVNEIGNDAAPQVGAPSPVEEELSLDELLSEEKEEKEEDEKEEKAEKDEESDKPAWLKENISLKKELAEYRSTVTYLRDRINEVNLLNAKLLYTNKLFKQTSLTNEQKLKVIESFDLTKSVREAKIVYATLAESFNFGAKKVVPAKPSATVKALTEGLASKAVASTKPTKPVVLTEGAEMANRFKKLAGIR